tara:strand:+ start:1066 stop:1431 length:366 start_codon:yes stop_codon:yes gene_type:complete
MFMDSKHLAELAAEACEDKKANKINLINIEEVSSLCDWILITNGLSDVQVRSIITSVETRIKVETSIIPIRKEGISEAKWALLDYGDLIVNVFQLKERNYYDLEVFGAMAKQFCIQVRDQE